EFFPADGTSGSGHIKRQIELDKQESNRIRTEMQQGRPLAATLQSISGFMGRAQTSIDKDKKFVEEKREQARAAIAIAEEQEAHIAEQEVEFLELQRQRADILRAPPPPLVLQGADAGRNQPAVDAPANQMEALLGAVGAGHSFRQQAQALFMGGRPCDASGRGSSPPAAAPPSVPVLDIANVGSIRQRLMHIQHLGVEDQRKPRGAGADSADQEPRSRDCDPRLDDEVCDRFMRMPLLECLVRRGTNEILVAQEHHAVEERLGEEVQASALDLGRHGIWGAGPPPDAGSGNRGGVRVLAPSRAPAGGAAGHEGRAPGPWGPRRVAPTPPPEQAGVGAVTIFLRTRQGMPLESLGALWKIVKYLKAFDVMCLDWVATGDFLMASGVLPSGEWARPAGGSIIDYFLTLRNLAGRPTAPSGIARRGNLAARPCRRSANEAQPAGAGRSPRAEPKQPPRPPLPGRARRPRASQAEAQLNFGAATSASGLAIASGLAARGIGAELVNRHDIATAKGRARCMHADEPPQCKWKQLQRQPKLRRAHLGPEVNAHAAAVRRAAHLPAVRKQLGKGAAMRDVACEHIPGEGSRGQASSVHLQKSQRKLLHRSSAPSE
ncbi:unnamed protein product, partial [Prorocentrum cordatum]